MSEEKLFIRMADLTVTASNSLIQSLRISDPSIVISDDEGNPRVRIYRDRLVLDERFTLDENAKLFVEKVNQLFRSYVFTVNWRCLRCSRKGRFDRPAPRRPT